MTKLFFVAVSALLLMADRSNAIEVVRTEIPGKHITLVLPADWEGIPPHIVEEYKNIVVRSSTNPAEVRTSTMNWVFRRTTQGG